MSFSLYYCFQVIIIKIIIKVQLCFEIVKILLVVFDPRAFERGCVECQVGLCRVCLGHPAPPWARSAQPAVVRGPLAPGMGALAGRGILATIRLLV